MSFGKGVNVVKHAVVRVDYGNHHLVMIDLS